MIVLDRPCSIFIEQAKGNLVLGVGLAEEVLKVAPIMNIDLSTFSPVSNAVEDRILFSLDFVLSQSPLAITVAFE